ncbi:MAG TPA: TIR domain-containing protein [Candidatus Kapabacteria bacterium]|nr:TIR domain-containing protein [Candidatus Kapabacteria bacterium]
MTADVFISYSREDKDRVTELANKLREAGVSLWIDQGGIDGAAMWSEEIVNALDNAKVLLLMITERSVTSHNVVKEVTLASERKGHILPIHLEPTRIPAALKYPLAGIQHIEYFQGDPGESLKSIIRSLERLGVVVTPPEIPAVVGDPLPETASHSMHSAEALGEHGALAVLPFDNISPDKETDYFSDGLTEELIGSLSVVSNIELVSRWASMQYKDAKKDLKIIGRELGARFIVGGSVRKFQENVRITAQLVDIETNRQLWGNTYKGKLEDIFEIQENVAKQIVEALKLKLSFTEKISLSKRPTVNVQAYDLYLRGKEYLYRRTKRHIEYAIQLFEKAIELDPRFAAAYAGASSAYGQLYASFQREEKYKDKAQELSFKALMYDNNLPEAYAAMGLSYLLWNRFDEAAASSKKAIELDPDDFIAVWTLGRIYFSHGDFADALPLFRKVIELKPGFYAAYNDLKLTYRALGKESEAGEMLQKLLEILPNYLLQSPDDARARMFYAHSLAESGNALDAKGEGAAAIELSPGDALMMYNACCLYAQLGEIQLAVKTLKDAIAAGHEEFEWIKRDSDLDAIRNDPEYIELMKDK